MVHGSDVAEGLDAVGESGDDDVGGETLVVRTWPLLTSYWRYVSSAAIADSFPGYSSRYVDAACRMSGSAGLFCCSIPLSPAMRRNLE